MTVTTRRPYWRKDGADHLVREDGYRIEREVSPRDTYKRAWQGYTGPTVLDQLSRFKKEAARSEQPLRFPVQDVTIDC